MIRSARWQHDMSIRNNHRRKANQNKCSKRVRSKHWNPHNRMFDVFACACSKISQMDFSSILNAVIVKPANLQYRGITSNDVPSYVRSHLAKGDKFVPSRNLPSFDSFYNSLDAFSVSVAKRAVACDFPERPCHAD